VTLIDEIHKLIVTICINSAVSALKLRFNCFNETAAMGMRILEIVWSIFLIMNYANVLEWKKVKSQFAQVNEIF
jgi:hypothetical protein